MSAGAGKKLSHASHTTLDADVESATEKEARRSAFIAVVAHELRQPLQAMRTAAAALRLRHPDEDEAIVGALERGISRMARLTDDLMDVVRLDRQTLQLRQEVIDLRVLVEDAVGAYRPAFDRKRLQLDMRTTMEPLWTIGDPQRLQQVISNLIDNAVKFTPSLGRIAIYAAIDADAVVFCVRDNGRGLDTHELSTIFGLFTRQSSSTGLGIGLAVARWIVDLHGGRIAASSEGPDRGAEFVVRLPRWIETALPRRA